MVKSARRDSPLPEGRRTGAAAASLDFAAAVLAICAFKASATPWPVASTTTIVWLVWLLEIRRVGRIVTAAANSGTARGAIQNPLFWTRDRYSRLRTTKILSSRIAHRLHEDLFELRLFRAELADFQEPDHLPQRLGAVGVRPEHQLHLAVLDRGLLHFGHRLQPLEVPFRQQPEGVASHSPLDVPELAVQH